MNSKTPIMILQEFMQKSGIIPFYEFIDCEGGVFKCRVRMESLNEIGVGRTKKEAKQNAAQIALEKLHGDGKFFPSGNVINLLKTPTTDNWENNVCKLQDLCTEYSLGIPEYDCISETGPPHSKQFIMKCTIGSTSRTAAAGTKKLAKQLSAGKVIDYFSTNIPERLEQMEELANLEKVNNDALSKFSHLDPAWRPNLGQMVSEYYLGLYQHTERERFEEAREYFNNNSDVSDTVKIETLTAMLSLDCEWSPVNSCHNSIMCLDIKHSTPPICLLASGENEEQAKINVAKEAVEYFNVVLNVV